MEPLDPSPASEASAGRVHRRSSVAVLKNKDADASHRLCAKHRSGGGAYSVEIFEISLLRKRPPPWPSLRFGLPSPQGGGIARGTHSDSISRHISTFPRRVRTRVLANSMSLENQRAQGMPARFMRARSFVWS